VHPCCEQSGPGPVLFRSRRRRHRRIDPGCTVRHEDARANRRSPPETGGLPPLWCRGDAGFDQTPFERRVVQMPETAEAVPTRGRRGNHAGRGDCSSASGADGLSRKRRVLRTRRHQVASSAGKVEAVRPPRSACTGHGTASCSRAPGGDTAIAPLAEARARCCSRGRPQRPRLARREGGLAASGCQSAHP